MSNGYNVLDDNIGKTVCPVRRPMGTIEGCLIYLSSEIVEGSETYLYEIARFSYQMDDWS